MNTSDCIKTAHFPDTDEFVDLAVDLHGRIAANSSNGNNPGQFLAWAFDTLCERIGMLKALPEATETPERLEKATTLAYLVAAMLQAGVTPAKLPWEQLPWEQDGEAVCRVCEVAMAASDGLCDGCRSATITERARG